MSKHFTGKHLLVAFGVGALAALILPKAVFCLLGTGLLLTAGYALACQLARHQSEKELMV